MASSAPPRRSPSRRRQTALGVTAGVMGLLAASAVALVAFVVMALRHWAYDEDGDISTGLQRWGILLGVVAVAQASGAVLLLCGRGWSLLASGHLVAACALIVLLNTDDGLAASPLVLFAGACAAALVLTLSPPVRRWASPAHHRR